jgi:hypothetical protein
MAGKKGKGKKGKKGGGRSKVKSPKRSAGRSSRSPAQQAATAKMLAAKAAKSGGGGSKKKKKAKKSAGHPAATFGQRNKAPDATGKHTHWDDVRGHERRVNPVQSNPKKKKRRKNPGMPAAAMSAMKAVVGGGIAAGAAFGAIKLMQRFPAPNKAVAVGALAAGGVLLGGGLAAAGMPAAGTVAAAGLGTVAVQTAFGSSESAQVHGLVSADPEIRGLVSEGSGASRRRLPPGDSYDQAQARQEIRGLVAAVSH